MVCVTAEKFAGGYAGGHRAEELLDYMLGRGFDVMDDGGGGEWWEKEGGGGAGRAWEFCDVIDKRSGQEGVRARKQEGVRGWVGSWCGLGCRSRTLMVEYINPHFFQGAGKGVRGWVGLIGGVDRVPAGVRSRAAESSPA